MSARPYGEEPSKVAWVAWTLFVFVVTWTIALAIAAPKQREAREEMRYEKPSPASIRHYQHRVYEVTSMLDSTEADLVACRRHVARAEVVLPRLVRFKLGKGAP